MKTFSQWRADRKADRILNRVVKQDGFADPYTSRGSTTDRTTRLTGNAIYRSWASHLELYKSSGILQTIIDAPANDAVREWITIKTNQDDTLQISRLINNRLEELQVQEKLFDLIHYSRLYSKGSWLYFGVIAQAPQIEQVLKDPLPLSTLEKIDYINVIDNPDHVSLTNENSSEPLKKDYNKVKFSIQGSEIHNSRLVWLCNNYNPRDLQGISVIDKVFDAISAQDSALWSCSNLVQDMATKIFKSDLIANMSPEKRGELLEKLKHLMITMSSLALTKDEDFQKLTYNVTGMKEVFDFIIDNLAGVSEIPKSILLGKAHGVVTAGEYDTLNYYAKVSQFQENKARPIIDKIIDMIIREQRGEIWGALGGQVEDLDWDYEFNTLWVLDPAAQADVDLKNAQRDAADFTTGKATSSELRELDPRYSELQTPEAAAIAEAAKVFK